MQQRGGHDILGRVLAQEQQGDRRRVVDARLAPAALALVRGIGEAPGAIEQLGLADGLGSIVGGAPRHEAEDHATTVRTPMPARGL